jgi:hypothetical protein
MASARVRPEGTTLPMPRGSRSQRAKNIALCRMAPIDPS